jgi:hypothetical protein
VLACAASGSAGSVYPMMMTPCFVTTLPGSVSSQLPPCSEAMSTMTLPGFIDCTISAVISFGRGLPGMSAVVMMMSTSFACFAKVSRCAFWKPSLITFA